MGNPVFGLGKVNRRWEQLPGGFSSCLYCYCSKSLRDLRVTSATFAVKKRVTSCEVTLTAETGISRTPTRHSTRSI